MLLQETDLDDIFGYHPPQVADIQKYEVIRAAGREFASVILRNTPASPDQSTAIRKVREAVMVANASVALDGRY